MRFAHVEARQKAQRLRFTVINDPVDFLARVSKQDKHAAGKKGNVVLSATDDTDFGIVAQIAAAFTGAFYTTPSAFAEQDSPKGIQYTDKLRSSDKSYHVAITAALQDEFPTLSPVLRALAQAPTGCVAYYLNQKRLCKFFKKQVKIQPRLVQRVCVLCRSGEQADVDHKLQQLYNSPKNWVLRFDASVAARCPGTGPLPK